MNDLPADPLGAAWLAPDRVLRSIEQNRGELSNVLAKEMPVLQESGVWAAVVEAASRAFRDGAPLDGSAIERYRPGRPAGRGALSEE